MQFVPTSLPGVVLVEPRVYDDARGFFMETFRRTVFEEAGLPGEFVQDNHSRSCRGTIRGLHYQLPRPQGKLVRVVRGAAFDVAVDLRRGSPTFGRWEGFELTEVNRRQLYIPPGFAHGFCVTSEVVELIYRCTDYYYPAGERTIAWNDPALAIDWPAAEPILSEKDCRGVAFAAAEYFP